MTNTNVIGIVGGLGPYAGVDTVEKIFLNTISNKDQDHLPVIMISRPSMISDRSEFLLGKIENNPGYEIVEVIKELKSVGANIIGIPCNTAHADPIMDIIKRELAAAEISIVLLNIVNEVIKYIDDNYPGIKKVGVLGTTGVYVSGVYKIPLENAGFQVVLPSEEDQKNKLHEAIYNNCYGIKVNGNQVTDIAKKLIFECMKQMAEQEVDLIVLACTELQLAIDWGKFYDKPVIDSSNILARALVREADENKLRVINRYEGEEKNNVRYMRSI